MSSAVEAVDTVTNAPMELVNSVTNRVRSAFKPRRASDESVALGQAKAEQDARFEQASNASVTQTAAAATQVVKEAAVTAAKATQEAVAEQREQRAEQRVQREEKAAAKRAVAEKTAETAATMADAVTASVDEDAAAASKYFTYDGAPQSADSQGASAQDR